VTGSGGPTRATASAQPKLAPPCGQSTQPATCAITITTTKKEKKRKEKKRKEKKRKEKKRKEKKRKEKGAEEKGA
jgi:hypothetical protein